MPAHFLHRFRLRFRQISILLLLIGSALVVSGSPQISHVHPDWPGRHLRPEFSFHHVLTGESFGSDLVFKAVRAGGDPREAIRSADFDAMRLPSEPPSNASTIRPADIEEQVAVAALGENTLVWAQTGNGYSEPYLLNAAKPFWVSVDSARPGDVIYAFGFRIRGQVALRNSDGVYFPEIIREARSSRHTDPNLVYFVLPDDVAAGAYEVYMHNGHGGSYGWRKAGDLEIKADPAPEKALLNVRDFGATGEGVESDLLPLRKAIAAAKAKGGARVYLPPGTYRIEETLRIPEGVELIGAGGDQSIIEGFRYDPHAAMRRPWWAPSQVAASVLVMNSDTRLEQLGVRGMVSRGSGGYGLITGASDTGAFPKNITIKGCHILAAEEDTESPRHIYRAALVFAGSERISILDNDISGSLEMRPGTYRSEIINNTIRRGTAKDVVSVSTQGANLLIDGNLFVDTPGRLVVYRATRSYIRYNEIHNHGRAGWENVPEPFLLHGGSALTVGNPSAADEESLQDEKQAWQKDAYQGATVLITHGRGKGQFRIVKGNNADTLYLDRPWRVVPDATSEYSVGDRFTENMFYGNQNHTPGRTSLWLDCISNVVEMHRDAWAGGIDIWGQDRSRVDAQGRGHDLHRFHTSWYNVISDNWLDGTSAGFFRIVGLGNNAYRGVPQFGNFLMLNRIQSPHLQRNPSQNTNFTSGGIRVEGGEGRIGTSHTMVIGNSISDTPVGVRVSGDAYKTFVIRNQFHEVRDRLQDGGIDTIAVQNGTGVEASGEREKPEAYQPPSLAEPFVVSHRTGHRELEWLRSRLAWRAFAPTQPEASEREQTTLAALYALVEDYWKANGHLPDASFYPIDPESEKRSLVRLLGDEGAALLKDSSTEPLENIQYLWNESLSGQAVEDPAELPQTWLMMDYLAAHPWMVGNGFAGEGGSVHVLMTDGVVRRMPVADALALIR